MRCIVPRWQPWVWSELCVCVSKKPGKRWVVGLDHQSSLTRSSSYSRGLYFKRYRHDSVQITFLVFGECAETQPFLRRRPTRPHTPSGNVECPVDWTHPVLYSTLLYSRGEGPSVD